MGFARFHWRGFARFHLMLISFNMFFAHYSLQHLVVASVVVIDALVVCCDLPLQ